MAKDDKRSWHVVSAAFEQSASKVTQCPRDELPEVAIAGRSNVGKSSLLNALCLQRGLARVSRTPGRTQLLNLFRLTLRGPGNPSIPLRFCDLPGYGFAAANRSIRDSFAPMIEGYLKERENLRGLILLVDIRRGVGDLDRALMEFLAARELPTVLVATKADKLGASARGLARKKIAGSIGVRPRDVLLTSSSSGLGVNGADSLASDIGRLVEPRDPVETGEPEPSADPATSADDGAGD